VDVRRSDTPERIGAKRTIAPRLAACDVAPTHQNPARKSSRHEAGATSENRFLPGPT